MADMSPLGKKLSDSGAIEITGKVMVVAVLILFCVVVCVFLLHLYAKWFWNRNLENSSNPNGTRGGNRRRRRSRLDFSPGYQAALRRGLDPSVLKTIPVLVFSVEDFKDGLECAVCLSEVSEGEKARLLPKCNHGFHMECIDMWFLSHSTCPLCRDAVAPEVSEPSPTLESTLQVPAQENQNASNSTEPLNFPTNVLFWGDETQVSTFGNCLEEGHQIHNPSQPASPPPPPPPPPSSSSSTSTSTSNSTSTSSNRANGALIIDIPSQIQEDEESKSPVPTRLRSLKRLLSRDRRLSPRSPRDLDLEQQG